MFDVWKNVLSEIEEVVPHFDTWFADVNLVSTDNGVIVIEAPNVFKVTQIKKKYDNVIKEAFLKNGVKFEQIEYVVSSSTKIRPRSREITLGEVNKRTAVSRKLAKESKVASAEKFKTGLSPDYTMDNFIVGSNNDVAVAVANAVIENPGNKTHNPFFLYGGPGLGKTHLVQAIGNAIVKKDPSLKVLYLTTDEFFSDFLHVIRYEKNKDFQEKYKKVDVLIIDDFQAIIKKDATQVAFFNIFNDLYQRGKQIIVTSDRVPEEIKTLDQRLSSRLAWAGEYDLQLPSFEDKFAILKAKAEYEDVEIEDEAIEYIANSVKTNIRDLEKEYRTLLTWAEVKNITPLEVINSGLSTNHSEKRHSMLNARQIVEAVARFYDLSVKEMCGKSRVSHIKNARQVAMYLLSEELGMSTTKIALEVGVKDHTTVMHGIKKIKASLKLDFGLREQIANIRESLYA